MSEGPIFRLTSGEGYGAVVNGNFVKVTIGMGGYYASVYAFLSDDNGQFDSFDNIADAVNWAVTIARTHQGQPRERSPIAYWEIRKGYSITVELTDSGEYEGETFALWIDSEPEPFRNFKRFPSQEDAVQWARTVADEQADQEREYELRLLQIKGELEAQSD